MTGKGRVTIPKAIRTKLGIGPGTVLDFEADQGRLVCDRGPQRDAVDEVHGTLKMEQSVDDFIERIRGR